MSTDPNVIQTGNDWIACRIARGEPRLRLICLPQAGGGAGTFSSWRPSLPEGLELAAVELPGRGTRSGDPLPATFAELIEILLEGIADQLTEPFAFFGHSFGAMLAYAVTLRLEQQGGPAPVALLVSASRAPHLRVSKRVAERSDEALLAWLLRNGGMPQELLRYPQYVRYVMGAIRNDLLLAESYCTPAPVPVSCRLHVLGGAADQIAPVDELAAWRPYTDNEYSLTVLPGGHGYPYTDPAAMLAAITAVLPEVSDSRKVRVDAG